MRLLRVCLLIALMVSVPSYAADDWARRYPSGTALQVITPTTGASTYLNLSGSNANQDISLGSYDFTANSLTFGVSPASGTFSYNSGTGWLELNKGAGTYGIRFIEMPVQYSYTSRLSVPVDAALYSNYSYALDADDICAGFYGYFTDSGNTAGSGHGMGGLFLGTNTITGEHELYGAEGRVNGHSGVVNQVSNGLLGLGQWSDPVAGNTTTFQGITVGLQARHEIFAYDESTPRLQGSSIGLWVKDGIGGLYNYGILVADQTGGTNDYGVVIAGADTSALWVGQGADNTDAANGITFGASADTNLYRSAANTLKTDDTFTALGALNVGSTSQFGVDASGNVLTTGTLGAGATTLNSNSLTGLLVEQNGVKDNTLIVDTTNGRVGVNMVPSNPLDIAGNVVINDASVNGLVPLRIEGDTDANLLYTNGATNSVGIGTSDFDGTPATGKLIVKGSTNDGSTNAQVWRDSDEANVATLDTNGLFSNGVGTYIDYDTFDGQSAEPTLLKSIQGSALSPETSGKPTLRTQTHVAYPIGSGGTAIGEYRFSNSFETSLETGHQGHYANIMSYGENNAVNNADFVGVGSVMVARADRNAGGSGNDGDTGWAFWGHVVNNGYNAGGTVCELDFVNTSADMLGASAPYGIALRISSEGSTYHNTDAIYVQGNFDATKGWNTGLRLGGWKDAGIEIIRETYGEYDGIEMGGTDIVSMRNLTGTGTITMTNADNSDIIKLLSGSATDFAGMQIGRTTADGTFAVVGAAAEFFTDSNQADLIIRNETAAKAVKIGAGTGSSDLYITQGKVVVVNSLGVDAEPSGTKVHIESGGTSLANLTGKIYYGKDGDDGNYIGTIYQGSSVSDMFFGRIANGDDLIVSTANVVSPVERIRFPQAGGMNVASNGRLQFRDSAIYINSVDDGYLDLTADTGIRLNQNTTIKGITVYAPSATQTIDAAGDTILANAGTIILDPGTSSDYTLTSAPTIADGYPGQRLTIIIATTSNKTVKIQDQNTLANSNIQLPWNDLSIGVRDVVTLVFNGADWCLAERQDN